jgi:beta-galactosidase
MAGVWAEEIDSLYPDPPQRIVAARGNALGLDGEFEVKDYCDRLRLEGAETLATYKTDFYAGTPCFTVNRFGSGRVYYLATRPAGDAFHDGFARGLVRELKLGRCLDVDLPEGVTVQKRGGGGRTFLFLHNLRHEPRRLELGTIRLRDVADGTVLTGTATLQAFESRVLERA